MSIVNRHGIFYGFLFTVFSTNAGAQMPAAKLDLVKITDAVYAIHNDFVPGNVTVLLTGEGVLLVDTKFPVDYDNMMAMVKSLTDQPVVYVVDTHYHGDHTGNNARLQQMHAAVFASMQARRRMVELQQSGLPDVTIERHAVLHLGGKTIELHHFGRAHTGGDIVVLFKEDKVLAAGDMFTNGANVPELIDYAGGGSARDWTDTLDRVLQLDFDVVVPGHGGVTTKAVMREFRDSTVTLRNAVKQLITAGKNRDEIEAFMRREYHWIDLHVERSLDGIIAELK